MELKEFFEGLKFWQDQSKAIADVPAAGSDPKSGATVVSFSEADLNAAVAKATKEAADAERARVTQEFAETQKLTQQKVRGEAIRSEVTQLVAAGKVPPAWAKAGLAEFMAALDAETEIQFAEGAAKQKPLDWFRKFLQDLPEIVSFSEFAKRDPATGDAAAKLDALTKKKMEACKDLTYSAAFAEVQSENLDLAREYSTSI